MILTKLADLSFPLSNPVLIFSVILFIILFAPLILNKLKIPYLIGLIIAGATIGPECLGLLSRDSSIVLFGTVGLLYLMFLAGLEMDLQEFKKNRGKSALFGMYTFVIPMLMGILSGIYILGFSFITSMLFAAMLASHTLIAYPLVSKLGVAKNRAVNITVSGTIITDTLALLVLAVIDGTIKGMTGIGFWIRLGVSVVVFAWIVLYLLPYMGRWFFKKFDDNISQYIFVLGIVFLSAFLAEAAGVEPIIGAFLAGLAMNRLIPRTSPLMNRIEFVGNALFIPIFLIGVGMLIDYKTFFADLETIKVAVTMTIFATLSKFAAAWLTQKSFGFSIDERRLIFGLSNARVGATLAIVLVGYNIVTGQTTDGEPIRLLNESVLNGTVLMILLTCTIASFAAQKGASNIALSEVSDSETDDLRNAERILIPVSNMENIEELISLSIVIKSNKTKSGLYALNVIKNDNPDAQADKKGKKILNKAASTAAATDHHIHELLRYDFNVSNAINSVVNEHKITDLILGLHNKMSISDSFLGNLTEGILAKSNCTTLIYKSEQPISTIGRHMIVIPERA